MPELSNQLSEPIISFSLIHYLHISQNYVNKMKQYENNVDFFCRMIHPYEFIHNKVPGSKFSVSKIKSCSPIFYMFMEIIHTFTIFDSFQNKNIISLHCSANNDATIECINIFRENNDDINYENKIENEMSYIIPLKGISPSSIDFLYYELCCDTTNICSYILHFIGVVCNLITYQSCNGVSIIKIDTLLHKPILDIIYLLTCMYDKVYIIKPNVSSSFNNERFIVCKQFIGTAKQPELYDYATILSKTMLECIYHNKCVHSLLEEELPFYFLNKIEDSNIIIGHLQLEQYTQLINLIKNKNRDDKIEVLKKNNIQKCIQWCEKYKIPYNKFVEKLNIFLPIVFIEEEKKLEIRGDEEQLELNNYNADEEERIYSNE
uniref:Uncharacterized protein n=1 Tax=viral metagenome TaxID=1070528 RepID=A0A6C0AZV7_9ZZZZ